MARLNAFALSLSALVCLLSAASAQYQWETNYFTQFVDQFDYHGATSNLTYQEKYLINDTWWKAPNGPIFFYTGNEGAIELFAENTGFLWEIAPAFGALVVFAEHRYYGINGTSSMPFGNRSYSGPATLAYLSSEQALADYAALVDSLKTNLSATDAPVVSFGGSYGGMLSSWFRMKYPASTVGAIAASAPIRQFTNLTAPQAWNEVVTHTWATANPTAPECIWNLWGNMTELAQRQDTRDMIRGTLGICEFLDSPEQVTNQVFGWISNAISYMTMADYPYPANFLGPMPAWPVNVSAAYLTTPNASVTDQMTALNLGLLTTFYNYTGQAGECFNLTTLAPPGLSATGWDWQSCTEMIMPIGQYGWPTDMFYEAPWSLPADIKGCQAIYDGTTPRPNAVRLQYGVQDLRGVSNIVFSNGDLDPWSSGGVTANITGNPSIIALIINGGAHHLDLRASNPADPPAVIEARLIEQAAIRTWINSYYESKGMVERV